MPFRCLFVGMRQRQNGCLREWSTDNLEANRKAGNCKTARNRDRRQPQCIKGRRITNAHCSGVRPLRDRDGRAWQRRRDQKVDGGKYLLDLSTKQIEFTASLDISRRLNIREILDDPLASGECPDLR